jgi:hypothetical protein
MEIQLDIMLQQTCIHEIANDTIDWLYHQVHIDWRSDTMITESLANTRTDCQVGHVMVVHDIEVNNVSTGCNHVVHFLAQLGEVR